MNIIQIAVGCCVSLFALCGCFAAVAWGVSCVMEGKAKLLEAQRGVIVLGHDGPRVGYEDMTALVCPEVKFNRTRNVPRTSEHSHVAWVLHGSNRPV